MLWFLMLEIFLVSCFERRKKRFLCILVKKDHYYGVCELVKNSGLHTGNLSTSFKRTTNF